jgi:hypothetical protein
VRTPDDDDAEMDADFAHRRPDDATRDSLMTAGAELEGVLREMRDLGRTRPPRPSPELEALLTKGLPNLRQRRRRAHRRKVLVGAVLIGSMSTSLTGIAAANDRLPGRSQNMIAGVINGLTPFHIDDRHPHPGAPQVPEETDDRSTPGHPASPEPSGEPGDDRAPQSPEPSAGTDPQPGTGPTPSWQERETEPGSSPTAPWGSESEGGDQHRSSTAPSPSGERSGDR